MHLLDCVSKMMPSSFFVCHGALNIDSGDPGLSYCILGDASRRDKHIAVGFTSQSVLYLELFTQQYCRAKAKTITSIFGDFSFFVSMYSSFQGAYDELNHIQNRVKTSKIFRKYVFWNYYVLLKLRDFKG